MDRAKIFAFTAAFMMFAVAGIAIVDVSDDSDAVTGTGSMKVYIYKEVNNVMTWTYQSVSGYNATKAIMNTSTYSASTADIDTVYDYTYQYGGETYYDISPTYGTISKFNNISNDTTLGTSWHMMVYTKTGSETTYSWKLADAATGWYKPYEDYATVLPAYTTANVALYYGTDSDFNSMKTSLITYAVGLKATIGLTEIDYTAGSAYEYTFYIKNTFTGNATVQNNTVILSDYSTTTLDVDLVEAGVTIIGYGSDAALALKNAVGANNVQFTATTNPVPGYYTYGWMEKMFNLDYDYDTVHDVYTYWQSFTLHTALGDSTNVSAPLGTGAYSSLIGAPAVDGTIAFLFQPYTA